ncbi:MAG: potassium transporter Kup [Methylococcales bacterium]|nr:potassium transporter Kup [Methylococcales bacterium]
MNSENAPPVNTRIAAGKGADSRLASLSLAALGIVFGDIGTSPLYAFRQSIHGEIPIMLTESHIFGVLSLIFWALIIVISIKYLIFMLQADNEGEGGILALLALLRPWSDISFRSRKILMGLGMFGAALLYGDGMITPAISVLSAIEGLGLAAPALKPYVIPCTLVILVLLFLFQKNGTARIGMVFGPVMLVWFLVLAVLGLNSIIHYPAVVTAVNPLFAIDFLLGNGWDGFFVLGAVFLVVTGGEALYADMGHFGKQPIRLVWFVLVLPALLLNYFGQGALVLNHPQVATEPFYSLAPAWALYPLIALATLATVIASQAVISGAFSLTHQAIQLGHCPRLTIVQTSSEMIGQIYIPLLNACLLASTLALVVGFGSSARLASAYGVAVTTTMVITTVLVFFLMRGRWGWRPLIAGTAAAGFLTIDLSFFAANLDKIPQGGWIPLLVAGLIFIVLSTWRLGRAILEYRLKKTMLPLDSFLDRLQEFPPQRVKGTAVFMTGRAEGTPAMLLHHLEHNQVLHQQVILLTVAIRSVPRVPAAERLEIGAYRHGLYRVIVCYGFMQSPNIPVALRECERFGLKTDPQTTTFYLARETLIASSSEGMAIWRKNLFAVLSRNSGRATAFYSIPPERVVEIGMQVEL